MDYNPLIENFIISKKKIIEDGEREKMEILEKIEIEKKVDTEYKRVEELMETLPLSLNHEIMIPMSNLAYIPGSLIHTNEYMVNIGEDWYVTKTAKQTSAIIKKKRDISSKSLDSLNNELEYVNQRIDEIKNTYDIQKEKIERQFLENNKKINEENLSTSKENKNQGNSKKEGQYDSPVIFPQSKNNIKMDVTTLEKSDISESSTLETKYEDKGFLEDLELLAQLKKLELEEKEEEYEEEEYKPYPAHRGDTDEEDEDENYLEGLRYALGDLNLGEEKTFDEKSSKKSESPDQSYLKALEALSFLQKPKEESTNKPTQSKKKQVRFSESVVEPSNREPSEFRSNPLWNNVSRFVKKNNRTSNEGPNSSSKSDLSSKPKPKKKEGVMRMKVSEKETYDNISYEQLDESLDFQILKDLYTERKSQLIAAGGGYSTPLKEKEEKEYNRYIFDEYEEPAGSSSNDNDDDLIPEQIQVAVKPKKLSKFKAARLKGTI